MDNQEIMITKTWNDLLADWEFKLQKGEQVWAGNREWAQRQAEHYNVDLPDEEGQDDAKES